MEFILVYGKINKAFFKQAISTPTIAISFLILIVGCVNKKNKDKLFAKTLICNQLWREKFRVFSGGAYSAELYSDYITDSTNFRIYIGSHDEYSSFDYQCNGDVVTVRKFSHNGNVKTIVQKSTLSLSEMRKERKFE
jgi:hypothetical protein